MEQCSQAGQRGDLTSWGVQAAGDGGSGKCSAGVQDAARGGVSIPRNCLEETEEIMVRKKKKQTKTTT